MTDIPPTCSIRVARSGIILNLQRVDMRCGVIAVAFQPEDFWFKSQLQFLSVELRYSLFASMFSAGTHSSEMPMVD